MTEALDIDPGRLRLACFRVAGQLFAIDVLHVKEIVRPPPLTPLPRAPRLIEGVIDLRGAMIPVLDLGRLLGNAPVEDQSSARIVVLSLGELVVGLRVEAAVDVLEPDAASLGAAPMLATEAGYELIDCVVRREGEAPVLVLSSEHLLESVLRSSAMTETGEMRS